MEIQIGKIHSGNTNQESTRQTIRIGKFRSRAILKMQTGKCKSGNTNRNIQIGRMQIRTIQIGEFRRAMCPTACQTTCSDFVVIDLIDFFDNCLWPGVP